MLARIGQFVSEARQARGLSVEALAASAGVSVEALRSLEAGGPGVSTSQLAALAKWLHLDADALIRGERVERPMPSVYLRHNCMQDFHDADLAVLDGAVEQGRLLQLFARLLGDEVGFWAGDEFVATEAGADAAQQAYVLARELRRRLALPTQPLGDLREMVEQRLGIAVLVRRLSAPGVAAVAVKASGAAAIVVAESALRHRAPAIRVSLAHEVCHVLHDVDTGGVQVVVDLEADARVLRSEQRARAFAAELMLPLAGLTQVLGKPRQVSGETEARRLVAQARDVFGTTWPIAANHLCNHGFVAREIRAWLEALDGPPQSRPKETRLPDVDGPSLQVVERARRAHEAGLITDGEARAALGIPVLAPLPWDGR